MQLQGKLKILFVISILFLLIYFFINRNTAPTDDLIYWGNKPQQLQRIRSGRYFSANNENENILQRSNWSEILNFPDSSTSSHEFVLGKLIQNENRNASKHITKIDKQHEFEENSALSKNVYESKNENKGTTTQSLLPVTPQGLLRKSSGNSLFNTDLNDTRITVTPSLKRKRNWVEGKIPGLSSSGVGNMPGFSDKPYPPYLIRTNGTFMKRVHSYNSAISKMKEEILKHRGYKEWQDVKEPNELTVIWGSVDDFLERLSNHKEVFTLVLPWTKISRLWNSSKDISNVLVKEYFGWSASQPLCEWIETPGFTKAHWDAVYNRTCSVDIHLTAKPQSLEWFYFHGKPINIKHYWPNNGLSYPAHFYTSPPLAIFYINILQDAVINLSGDVVSGGVKVVPYTCSHDYIPTVPIEYRERPIYHDVFVITQFWGTTYFHKMLEVMPRVAAYVEFLRDNPNVHIHAPEDHAQVSQLLQVLGLNPERIVTGVTRAKVVYLPQGTPCGFPGVHQLQLLSHHFRSYIHRNFPSIPRNRLVLVKRSGLRRFLHQEPIEQAMQEIARSYNLNFTLFSDSPTPSLHTTMAIFNSAVVVVAPHGAGLSNIIFSEPKTLVIEGVCNPPHVNMCFQFAAHGLGHRYHGIPSESGCERVVSVAPETIDTVVRELISSSNFQNAKTSDGNT